MTEREDFERQCLAEARASLQRLGVTGLEDDGKRLREVRLEGSYPDTRVVVEMEDLRPWRKRDVITVVEPVWATPRFEETSLYANVIEA